jgi:hypothetical protein
MKTIKQWFETLPEPYSSQAVANSLPGNLLAVTDSLMMAFSCGFSFKGSKEGLAYWRSFHDQLIIEQLKEQEQQNGK